MEDTNENKELIEEEDPQYNNPYRYFNTFIMVVSAIFNSFIVQTLSTINTEVTTYFPSVSTT